MGYKLTFRSDPVSLGTFYMDDSLKGVIEKPSTYYSIKETYIFFNIELILTEEEVLKNGTLKELFRYGTEKSLTDLVSFVRGLQKFYGTDNDATHGLIYMAMEQGLMKAAKTKAPTEIRVFAPDTTKFIEKFVQAVTLLCSNVKSSNETYMFLKMFENVDINP